MRRNFVAVIFIDPPHLRASGVRFKPLTDTTKPCLAFARQGRCFGLFAVLQASA